MTHPRGGSEEFYSVQGAGDDHGPSLWTVLGLVGIKVKFQHLQLLLLTSIGSMFLLSAVFILWGSASCKNNLGVCVRSLIYPFQETGSSVILLCGRITVPVP